LFAGAALAPASIDPASHDVPPGTLSDTSPAPDPEPASIDRTISSDREIGGSGSVQFTLDEKSKVTFDYDARANVKHRNMFRIRIYGRSPSGGWRNLETIVHVFEPD